MPKMSAQKAKTLSPISGMLLNKPGQVQVPMRGNMGVSTKDKIKAIGRGKKGKK